MATLYMDINSTFSYFIVNVLVKFNFMAGMKEIMIKKYIDSNLLKIFNVRILLAGVIFSLATYPDRKSVV